ncbi:Serpentine Receptor, class I [Caenorhabditis elegans]|uniref:Serpentine Receptor, class I n=1 Tax=Caenorhabditis elegans TaxID=6239 RepID=O16594_CAEEL|nr:Serpentine Receptor, class I [Caenorhabditis elegans]CCD68444.1 Serpentine Receptor, class I [Caenorhabditis elegans]|eukprot:NP_494305.2 Serpentine Receptor, class I [Caenorhabditis elegans]
MSVDFDVPLWLYIYYQFIGTVSLFLNLFTMLLILFKSEKIDVFRKSLLVFQATCTVTDIHFTFLMQPLPLIPIMAGYCVGFLARCFDVWTHYLIAFVVGTIVAQLESLTFCFVKKHQTIANITKRHVISKSVNDAVTWFMPFFPVFGYLAFCSAGMKREEQMDYVKLHHPEYALEFSNLPNFAIYELNFWLYLVICFGSLGAIFCGAVFTFTTVDMFKMLKRSRRKISVSNFKKQRSTIKSLLAQFAASSLLLIPLLCFSLVLLLKFDGSQEISNIILTVFSTRSSVNAAVLIATTPPFRNFVLRKNSTNNFAIATVAISMSRTSFT